MEFSPRKLPNEAASALRVCEVGTIAPYALMLAPVYVYLRRNEKFISVKAPLDFFTPEELDRLKSYEMFYMPDFVDSVLLYRSAARRVRAILGWEPAPPVDVVSDFPPVPLPPAPYELSDAVLRLLGPLWGKGTSIEPFFVAAFVNELCGLFSPDTLLAARERDVDLFEYGVITSGWTVFLALHLGYCDLPFLNRLRDRVFGEVTAGIPPRSRSTEVDELIRMAMSTISDKKLALSASLFDGRPERVTQKLVSRLERVTNEYTLRAAPAPSVLGPKGLLRG